MNNAETNNFIVSGLKKNLSRNDMIQTICEKNGLTWSEAEALIREVQEEHATEIESSQNTKIIALAWFFILGGIAVAVFVLLRMTQGSGGHSSNMRSYVSILITGIFMAVGGIIGLLRIFIRRL